MSIWSRMVEAIAALAKGEGLSAVFEKLRAAPDRTVAFAIAVIALGAKMAKADGRVTKDEVVAFREVFVIPTAEEANAARVFNLARQDVAGYDIYARRIKAMYGDDVSPLRDLLEGLFHIALADGVYHPKEDDFLHEVADIFGFDERRFRTIRAQFVAEADRDPYDVLGVEPTASKDEIRAAWRQLVRETHPDQMLARGVPEEAVKLAERRMVAINRAWEDIQADRK
ncbi:dimethylmenaquinone methyltransferase [Loktanella sp. 5RATIMAR09]|uniref:TerB family tellurite resistance protein n=1 Tax=Loktanella sp. 5RATIMAR09 TaxID=1225655 RepID=UPI0006EB2BB9|nr:TerB family tellurite resistance protein [Loktanella sp. 5RATIMAR09]KQI72057.1 dimethylmenaquinone methyltransferase [Loktanella sp. 5RATIMAR09]